MRYLVTILMLVAVLAEAQSPTMMQDWLRAARPAASAANDAYVTDWLARVSTAGGAEPSADTISALNTFCASLRANNLDTNMISMSPIVPDNLVAAITPLIKTHGADSWTNVSFVAGDLTTNGLQGATGKYLKTGVIPSTAFPATTDGGVSIYVMTNNTSGTYDSGAQLNGQTTNSLMLYTGLSGTAYWDCYGAVAGRISAANTLNGFISANRIATNDTKMFRANSATVFTNFVSGSTFQGTQPTRQFFFFSANNYSAGSDSPGASSTRTFTFTAIHRGLTTVQASNLFVAVQTLRTNLGGGYR